MNRGFLLAVTSAIWMFSSFASADALPTNSATQRLSSVVSTGQGANVGNQLWYYVRDGLNGVSPSLGVTSFGGYAGVPAIVVPSNNVPEPSTTALLAIGLAAIGFLSRRKVR